MEPVAGYARLGTERIAYQTYGEGPIDLVMSPGSFGAFDIDWEDPIARLFFRRLATFARLIRFDRRGTGASDPLPLDALPPWEAFVEELTCVMDSVGSLQAAVWAAYDAGPMAMLFAASKPERVLALILAHTSAKYIATEDYPAGVAPEEAERLAEAMEARWGTEEHVALQVPSRVDSPRFREWYARKTRTIAGPRAAATYFRSMFQEDARSLLPAIRVPTLVLHRVRYSFIPISQGRYLADHIDDAKIVELPGSDGPLIWEHGELTLEAVEEFLTGIRGGARVDRQLASLLFTDIVGSTDTARRVGDQRWRGMLDVHDELSGRIVEQHGGRLIRTTGDGIFATFDGPGRAIRAATSLRHELRSIGLEIRAGIHTAEVDLRESDLGGLAVYVAGQTMARANPGEILVTRTVRDLVAGSDLTFQDHGSHRLTGVDGDWHLFAASAPGIS